MNEHRGQYEIGQADSRQVMAWWASKWLDSYMTSVLASFETDPWRVDLGWNPVGWGLEDLPYSFCSNDLALRQLPRLGPRA